MSISNQVCSFIFCFLREVITMVENVMEQKTIDVKVGEKCTCDMCKKIIFESKNGTYLDAEYWHANEFTPDAMNMNLLATSCNCSGGIDVSVGKDYDFCSDECMDKFIHEFGKKDTINKLLLDRRIIHMFCFA